MRCWDRSSGSERSRRPHRRKINPGPPAQRFMKPPLSRYIALAQRRTNGAYVASRAIIGKEGWRPPTAGSKLCARKPRMLLSDRRLEIEERAQALRFEIFDQRQWIWPDRNPRGLDVADPQIAAQILGINFEYLEEIGFSIPSQKFETAGLLDRRKG